MSQEDREISSKEGKVEIIDSLDIEIEKETPPNLSRNYKIIIHKKIDTEEQTV